MGVGCDFMYVTAGKYLRMYICTRMWTYIIGMRQTFLQYVWAHMYKIKVKCGYFAFIEKYGVVWNRYINARSFIVQLNQLYIVVGI